MKKKKYYSSRLGKLQDQDRWRLSDLKKLFLATYAQLEESGRLLEWFGDNDGFRSPGRFGDDIEVEFFRLTKKESLWPIRSNMSRYTEEDLWVFRFSCGLNVGMTV